MKADQDGAKPTPVQRFGPEACVIATDPVAHEEPLEIQIGKDAIAVLMRTPGDDLSLVRGFLLTEGIVSAPEEIASIHHCSEAGTPELGNVVRATLRPQVAVDLEALKRNTFTSSSCGVCGKASMEVALRTAPPIESRVRFQVDCLYPLPERLRESQPLFAATGGLHAAALFDTAGDLLVVREDVGRHNAVDKVIGWAAARAGWPPEERGLLVSGRVSFEIVQKALAARIPLIAAVSAPSSLAVELADQAGIALVGFLREGRLNVYGRRERMIS